MIEHSMAIRELEQYVKRQRRQIRTYKWVVLILTVYVAAAFYGKVLDNKIISAQDGTIEIQVKTIEMLESNAKLMQGTINALEFEQVIR